MAGTGKRGRPRKAERKPDSRPLLERDELISKEDLATYLGRSEGTLDQWASRGGGPEYVIVGRHRMYEPAAVKKWMDERRYVKASEKADTGPFPAVGAA
jgi:helix-turn-helix protein